MPDTTIAIAIMLGSFVLLLMARMPISFTLGISSVLTALYLNIPLATLFQRMVSGVQSFSLLAIPFFILAGEIMGQGGISRRLITLANACVGWMRGGLAQVNILASMFFGGISGSAVADTSSIGSILIPMMTDSGYDKDFSVAVTVTSSCQGVMIPPSHNMILFAMAAGGGVSIVGRGSDDHNRHYRTEAQLSQGPGHVSDGDLEGHQRCSAGPDDLHHHRGRRDPRLVYCHGIRCCGRGVCIHCHVLCLS